MNATARPVPADDFSWQDAPGGLVLRSAGLEAVARHAFTSRQLRLRSGDPEMWTRAAAVVDCAATDVRRTRQVHGAAVHVVDGARAGTVPPPEADALVACTPGVALAVVAADCVPILLADPATGAVGAVHAGWRGTAADVAGAAVRTLAREFGVDPARLVAAIGPSIGACCYEVGEELIEAFSTAGHDTRGREAWFSRARDGRLRLDLWAANRDMLVRAGVSAERVHAAGLCTKTHVEWFESYRVEGPGAGRMAALVVAPER